MLKTLEIENFKSFRKETIRFSESGLNVIVGPNGAGKSTILEALSLLLLPPGEKLQVMVRRGADSRAQLSGIYESPNPDFEERWAIDRRMIRTRLSDGFAEPSSLLPNQPIRFDVAPQAMRTPLVSGQLANGYDATWVKSCLVDLKLGHQEGLAGITKTLQAIVPGVSAISIHRVKTTPEQYQFAFDMPSGRGLSAEQVSEGTLFALGIVTATSQFDDRTAMLLIDDIDRALHPRAQRELVKVLRSAVQGRGGKLQIICTTHSPYLVSEFKFDEVLVVKEIDGESKCMRLSDGPDAERWMKELDAGEYWSFIEPKLFAAQHK